MAVQPFLAHAPSGVSVEAAARYLHWGVVQISLTNLLVIVAMVMLFALALIIPFPGSRKTGAGGAESDDES